MGAVASTRPASLRRPALADAALALGLAAVALVELAVSSPPAPCGLPSSRFSSRRCRLPGATACRFRLCSWPREAVILASCSRRVGGPPPDAVARRRGRALLARRATARPHSAYRRRAGRRWPTPRSVPSRTMRAASAFGGLVPVAALGVGRAVRDDGLRVGRARGAHRDARGRAGEAGTRGCGGRARADRARAARRDRPLDQRDGRPGRSRSPGAASRARGGTRDARSVEAAGRDASPRCGGCSDLLRSSDDAPSGALPTLAHAPQLIADMRRAGLRIELEIDGDLDDVPPGRALAAYRIVQEALTNALKHAPDARVRVRIRRDRPSRSRWRCSRRPAPPRCADDGATGHGLVGMHERVALYGGRLARRARARTAASRCERALPLQAGGP